MGKRNVVIRKILRGIFAAVIISKLLEGENSKYIHLIIVVVTAMFLFIMYFEIKKIIKLESILRKNEDLTKSDRDFIRLDMHIEMKVIMIMSIALLYVLIILVNIGVRNLTLFDRVILSLLFGVFITNESILSCKLD